MAGRGPAPKPEHMRSKKSSQPVALKTIEVEAARQPALPDDLIIDGEFRDWPEPTLRWWKTWGESPLTDSFTATDWDFMLDTALIHARFWLGDARQAAELRQRMAKVGATPEDRARLRIQFASADESEDRRDRRKSVAASASRSRMRAVGKASSE